MSTDRPRYTVSVDDELLKQIEDYQFEHRYKTRSSATVELIRLGIQQLMQEQPKIAQNTAPVPALSADEQQLIDDYREFNDEGKGKVRDYVADLADNPKYKKCSESRLEKQA